MIKQFTIIFILICYFGIILLSFQGCQESFAPAITEQVNFEQTPITVLVHFYDHRRTLEQAAIKNQTEVNVDGFAVVSWAILNDQPVQPICDIHTLRVRGVSDSTRMETLGHEFLHCVYGLYHETGVR